MATDGYIPTRQHMTLKEWRAGNTFALPRGALAVTLSSYEGTWTVEYLAPATEAS